jgi:hypothetical protein
MYASLFYSMMHSNRFTGNTRYVSFVGDDGNGNVTVILHNAETDVEVGNWTQPNVLGRYSLPVEDSWFDARAITEWTGQDRNWTFYWEIIPSTHTIDGSEARQPTFVVVQTALPNSALSSSSASIISQSLASVSRAIASADASVDAGQQSLQSSRNDTFFPPWAIALIVILGVLSIVSILTLFFVLLRGVRRKRADYRRQSIGSESPMIAEPGNATSPVTVHATGLSAPLSPPVRNAPSIRYNDSVASRTNSAAEGVITGTDAAIMADAFRKALRKPDFADRPQEEGESPETNGEVNETEALLLNRELAEEGHNIRSVSSEKGVKVIKEEEDPK